jgi:tetratricopeptide (TPR) repeat protein
MNNKELAFLLILLLSFLGSFFGEKETSNFSREESGDHYFGRGEYQQAINAWEKALDSDRLDPRIFVKIGKGFLRLAKYERAEKFFKLAVEVEPGAVESHVELVRLSLLKGDLNAAEKRCILLKKKAPLDPEVEILLGDLAVLGNQPEKAEKSYRNALLISHGAPRSLLKLATCLVSLGKKQEADAVFAIADKPEFRTPRVLLQMADYFLVSGKDKRAEACLVEAVKNAPNDLSLKVRLACFYRSNRGLEKAEGIITSLVAMDPDNLYFKKMLGDIYLSLNKMDLAEAVIFSIGKLLQEPDSDYELIQGKYWLYRGNSVYAATHLKSAVDLMPGLALAHYLLGVAYLMGGQNQLGQNSIENALYIDPHQSRALVLMASILYKKGKYSLSIKYLNRLKGKEPENHKVHRLAGLNSLALGNFEKARNSFASALSLHPKDSSSRYYLGITAEHLGMETLALGCYKDILGTNPLLADVLYRCAMLFIKEGDSKAADDLLAAVVEKKPASPYSHYVAGLVALTTNRLEMAEKHLKRAVFYGILGDAHVSLADLYVRQGRENQAISILEVCTEKAPEFADAWIRLAGIYLKKDNPLEALEVMKRAEKSLPASSAILGNLAWLYLVTGADLDLALDFARKAYDKSPDDPAIGDTLAWAYYQKGAYGQASWLLLPLEGKEPENEMILYHYGMSLYRQGKLSEAVERLKKISGTALAESDYKQVKEILAGLEGGGADPTPSQVDALEFDFSEIEKFSFSEYGQDEDVVVPQWQGSF